MKPVYYLADFESGNLIYRFPMEALTPTSLTSGFPGQFQMTLDLRNLGESMRGARSVLDLMKSGTTTFVPVREGLSNGIGNRPISVELGEWWVSEVKGTIRSPLVTLAGPEFAGYLQHRQVLRTWSSQSADPVATARQMIWEALRTDQSVNFTPQNWISHSGARVPVDARIGTVDYWTAVAALQDAEDGPFEWMIRSGLVQDGWTPKRVTRTLEVGQPELRFTRSDVTLEVTAPGLAPASLLDATWSRDEARSATTMYGFGAGNGDDQIRSTLARGRVTGEPVKSRRVTVRTAMMAAQLRPHVRAALQRATPSNHVFSADMPTDRYTPQVGAVYSWRNDETWTVPARGGRARCVGWGWNQRDDTYSLDLVEV